MLSSQAAEVGGRATSERQAALQRQRQRQQRRIKPRSLVLAGCMWHLHTLRLVYAVLVCETGKQSTNVQKVGRRHIQGAAAPPPGGDGCRVTRLQGGSGHNCTSRGLVSVLPSVHGPRLEATLGRPDGRKLQAAMARAVLLALLLVTACAVAAGQGRAGDPDGGGSGGVSPVRRNIQEPILQLSGRFYPGRTSAGLKLPQASSNASGAAQPCTAGACSACAAAAGCANRFSLPPSQLMTWPGNAITVRFVSDEVSVELDGRMTAVPASDQWVTKTRNDLPSVLFQVRRHYCLTAAWC